MAKDIVANPKLVLKDKESLITSHSIFTKKSEVKEDSSPDTENRLK